MSVRKNCFFRKVSRVGNLIVTSYKIVLFFRKRDRLIETGFLSKSSWYQSLQFILESGCQFESIDRQETMHSRRRHASVQFDSEKKTEPFQLIEISLAVINIVNSA